MPLHVNLYHEIQQQELARKRDPLRLGMLGILVVAVGFVAYYGVVFEQCVAVHGEYASLQDEWSHMEPKFKAAKDRQAELNDRVSQSDALKKTVDGRFYMAPLMGQIVRTVPRNVQILHVALEAPASDAAVTTGLSMSGIAAAPEPRKAAEELRLAMQKGLGKAFKAADGQFRELEDSEQTVALDGQRVPTATFTIDFQIEVRGAAAPAPVPARRARIAAE